MLHWAHHLSTPSKATRTCARVHAHSRSNTQVTPTQQQQQKCTCQYSTDSAATTSTGVDTIVRRCFFLVSCRSYPRWQHIIIITRTMAGQSKPRLNHTINNNNSRRHGFYRRGKTLNHERFATQQHRHCPKDRRKARYCSNSSVVLLVSTVVLLQSVLS